MRHDDTLTLSAPAKVNLFLSVGPRDSRGYHPVRTVFQAVDLCDTVTMRLTSGPTQVTFDDASIPARNTVTMALDALRTAIELPDFYVFVEKRIPCEAGLGGGSSDAASVLRGACLLAGACVAEAELAKIALSVGADVPFFLVGGRARAEGYGEVLTPLANGCPEWLVIAQPSVRCSTQEMFARLDRVSFPFREFPSDDELYNDFERVAPAECLDLIEVLRKLGALSAGLTGSGSGVFGRFPDEASARGSAEDLLARNVPFAHAVATLNR